MAGFDFGSKIEGENTQPQGTLRAQLQYPLDQESIEAIRRALETTSTFKTIQLEPGEDIQETIDKLDTEGSGRIELASGTYSLRRNIELKDKVSLTGAGIDQTILDFGDSANGVFATGVGGGSPVDKENFLISDLTIQNSDNAAGLDLSFCANFRLENKTMALYPQMM